MSILDDAVAIAGVDPRELHARLMAAQPDRTIALARAFEDAGQQASATYEQARRAHGALADGFTNDAAPVFDAPGQSAQAWRLLGQGGQDMVDTATFLRRSVTALDQAQATSTRTLNRMVDDLNAVVATAARQTAPDPVVAAALRRGYLDQAAGIVTTAAHDVQTTIDAYDHELTGYTGELTARGYVPAAPTRPGHTTPRPEKHWWQTALEGVEDAGAAVYNHTVVPLVNGAADLGQAAVEHPGDVAGLLLGGGLMLLGGTGEVGGTLADATGVGALVGVPVNILAAGAIATGGAMVAASAGDLGSNAAQNHNQVLNQAQGPSAARGNPGDPLPESKRPDTAGSNWEGRVARSGKGEVWQKPEDADPASTGHPDANSVRIMDGDARYPNGYVRFYNKYGQPINLDGKPGGRPDTHIPIRPDGSYDVPQGWNP